MEVMKTQYLAATSIDGFIADENHSLDWLFQFGGPGDALREFMTQVGAIAMGSTTYEWLLQNQIYANPGQPKQWPYAQPVWVFTSRSLRVVENADIRFVSGDVRTVHREMARAAQGKNIWLMGGGDLVGQFHDQGLVNEIHLGMAPVMLAVGAPLLPRKIVTPPLKLLSVETDHASGFVTLKYEVVRRYPPPNSA
jgi:dihydrofolate reductase